MNDYIHATGTIIENAQGEILLLLRNKQNPEGGTWGLVGGKINPHEDKIISVIKKIRQEIGLEVDANELVFIHTFHWDRPDIQLEFDVFKLYKKDLSEIKLTKEGHIDYMWISPSDAAKRKDLMIGLYEILKYLL